MKRPYISQTIRHYIVERDKHRCSYCQTQADIVGNILELDHIIPLRAGDTSEESNLCLACSSCNQAKGSETSTNDPIFEDIQPLFNPYMQIWGEHFRWIENGTRITNITPVGRATIITLNMNRNLIVKVRTRWVKVGWHPPHD